MPYRKYLGVKLINKNLYELEILTGNRWCAPSGTVLRKAYYIKELFKRYKFGETVEDSVLTALSLNSLGGEVVIRTRRERAGRISALREALTFDGTHPS